MDNKERSTKTNDRDTSEDKRIVPVFVKYGIILVAIIVVITAGLFIYFNAAGGSVATIDGEKIGTDEFKYFLEVQKQTMYISALQVDPNISEETFWATKIGGEDAIEFAKKKAMDMIKDTKVQYIKAKDAKVSLTDDEIKALDNSIQTDIIDNMGEGNKIKANKVLQQEYGFSIDTLRNAQIQNYTVQNYRSQEINAIAVTEEDVDSYYAKNPEWFKEDSQFRKNAEEAVWARHILIMFGEEATQAEKDAAKKKAEDLIVRLKAGEEFTALVKENSEDPGSKDRGGDYVFGKGQMYPEFEKAAFALNPGQITETPVLSSSGYHILKLEEKYAQDEPVSLKCAKEYNEFGPDFLKYRVYLEKVAGWVKEAPFKLNEAAYNSVK